MYFVCALLIAMTFSGGQKASAPSHAGDAGETKQQNSSKAGDAALGAKIEQFINVTVKVLEANHALINKLATYQVKSVLTNVSNEARVLHDQKVDLRHAIRNKSIDKVTGSKRFAQLSTANDRLGRELDRFSGEIASASGLASGPLQSSAHRSGNAKGLSMANARTAWENDRPEQAERWLDAAISDTVLLEDAAKCLLETVNKGKAACNADSLTPNGSTTQSLGGSGY